MPDRVLREKILTSENVNKLSWVTEVFYRRLMSVVDDYGRFDGRASIIRAECFALKLEVVSITDVDKWLDECAAAGLVSKYTIKGKPYIELLQFGQKLKRMKAKYPEPPACTNLPELSAEEEREVNLILKTEIEVKNGNYAKFLLSQDGLLDKEAIELIVRDFIDEKVLKRFNAHLLTENKTHPAQPEYNKHLRNWLSKGKKNNQQQGEPSRKEYKPL